MTKAEHLNKARKALSAAVLGIPLSEALHHILAALESPAEEEGKEDRRRWCETCQKDRPHRFAPSPDAGAHWRCSECGSVNDETNAAASALDAIQEALGAPEWEYPGQVVRDVKAMIETKKTAEAEAADLRGRLNDEVGSVGRVIRMLGKWVPEARAGLLREMLERWPELDESAALRGKAEELRSRVADIDDAWNRVIGLVRNSGDVSFHSGVALETWTRLRERIDSLLSPSQPSATGQREAPKRVRIQARASQHGGEIAYVVQRSKSYARDGEVRVSSHSDDNLLSHSGWSMWIDENLLDPAPEPAPSDEGKGDGPPSAVEAIDIMNRLRANAPTPDDLYRLGWFIARAERVGVDSLKRRDEHWCEWRMCLARVDSRASAAESALARVTGEKSALHQRYHELLYAVLDPGMLDKRTGDEAHAETMGHVRKMRSLLEEQNTDLRTARRERDEARRERNEIGFHLQTALGDKHSNVDDMIDAVSAMRSRVAELEKQLSHQEPAAEAWRTGYMRAAADINGALRALGREEMLVLGGPPPYTPPPACTACDGGCDKCGGERPAEGEGAK